jgi:hypothetical protein
MAFNCLVLNTNTRSLVSIAYEGNSVILGQKEVPLKGLTVLFLRDHICKMINVFNSDDMKLWKINNNIKMSNIKNQNIFTEDDVKNKLNGEEMKPIQLFKKYFENELDRADKDDGEFAENIHIIATITGKCLPKFYKFTVTTYRFGLMLLFFFFYTHHICGFFPVSL